MKISGFTMVRNAEKFYFPIRESILSILPIVDEFIIALGDSDDSTEQIIKSIDSDKIKIFHRVWDKTKFTDGTILKDETNFALSKCTGDWCFYLQADEVVHENDHAAIIKACRENFEDKKIDGLLFNYLHFWGDYDHYLPFHGWYKKEIRIIRNNSSIVSFKDAQSFVRSDNSLLRVKQIPATIYHYGWVRPPQLMKSKKSEHDSFHGESNVQKLKINQDYFDYGPLKKIPLYKGSHPAIMGEWMKKFNWSHLLNYKTNYTPTRPKPKHERFKYKAISWVEKNLFGGREIFGYRNWRKIN